MMVDLALEMAAAVYALNRAPGVLDELDLPRLLRWFPPGPIGLLPVKLTSSGFWEKRGDGAPAIILPVLADDWPADIVDLVAWPLASPASWGLRVGDGVVLGAGELRRAALHGQPLKLHPTPAAWLRGGGEGACVLDFAACRWALLEVPELHCASIEHGRAVERALRLALPHMPKIKVPDPRRRRAT